MLVKLKKLQVVHVYRRKQKIRAWKKICEAIRGAGAQRCQTRLVWYTLEEIKFNIFICSLWYRGEVQRQVPPVNVMFLDFFEKHVHICVIKQEFDRNDNMNVRSFSYKNILPG